MPVELNITESVTELDTTVVTVTLESASEPGPAGPGVPTGGTVGQVLTKDSGTDYDTSWQDATGGGGGAPTDATYLVTTANGTLTDEVVVGATPGGELGGTWASPTVDATHSGSSHASVQAAAEATAAADLDAHEADTTNIHGIADTSALALTANVQPLDSDLTAIAALTTTSFGRGLLELANQAALLSAAGAAAASHTHAQSDITNLVTDLAAKQPLDSDLTAIAALTTTAFGRAFLAFADEAAFKAGVNLEAGTDFPSQSTFDDHSARHENGGADEISIAGLDGIPTELQTHLDDTTAHLASRIPFTPAGTIAATDVQAAIEEVASEAGGGGVPSLQYESRSSNTILGVADKGKVIDITAAITQTFEADETLGDGWWVILRNATTNGTSNVTLDPAGTETIDGVAQPVMYSGEMRLILCNGAGGNFNSEMLAGGFARFTADGTFKVPAGVQAVTIECIGAGGGGGGGSGRAVNNLRKGGSGGGGGARVRGEFPGSVLGSAGDSISVDVGAGGTVGSAGSGGDGGAGGAGDNTTFGSILTGYGGGGGCPGNNSSSTSSGGSGGGAGEAGSLGTNNATTRGGGNNTAALGGMGGAGGGSGTGAHSAQTSAAEWGGGGGGNVGGSATSNSGAGSMYGGAAGASGGGVTNANPGTQNAGSAGGNAGVYGIGGGGSLGAVGTNPGGKGDDGDLRFCGDGGGGGGGSNSGTGGAGGEGGAPGGGGGGGGGGTSTGGVGGIGGRGEARIWYQ